MASKPLFTSSYNSIIIHLTTSLPLHPFCIEASTLPSPSWDVLFDNWFLGMQLLDIVAYLYISPIHYHFPFPLLLFPSFLLKFPFQLFSSWKPFCLPSTSSPSDSLAINKWDNENGNQWLLREELFVLIRCLVVSLMVADSKVNWNGVRTDALETVNKESEATTTKEGTEEGESSFKERGCWKGSNGRKYTHV